MVRPVSEQPTGSFSQLDEIDIDFRVPGLSHAVVKEAKNFRVLELVKKIESHGVIRVVRNKTKSAMFPMSSLLESRSDLLHLRTLLG